MANQSILPAAAMFEAAAAAFSTTSLAAGADAASLLVAVAIAAPLALTARGDTLLDLRFTPATGALAAYSLNLLSAEQQLHLRASAARCSYASAGGSRDAAGSSGALGASPVPWQAIVMREAAAEMRRYDGGTLAAVDVSREQIGGYLIDPAVADSCLHTGAVFTAPTSTGEDGEVCHARPEDDEA